MDDDIALADLPDVLTVDEVRRVLRTGKNSVYELIHQGHIRSVQLGRGIRVPKAALIEFLERGSGH